MWRQRGAHRRFKNACPGTGRMGEWALKYPENSRAYDLCPVCETFHKVRKHASREHDWPAGSLVFHVRPPLSWWQRLLWGWR